MRWLSPSRQAIEHTCQLRSRGRLQSLAEMKSDALESGWAWTILQFNSEVQPVPRPTSSHRTQARARAGLLTRSAAGRSNGKLDAHLDGHPFATALHEVAMLKLIYLVE